MFITKKALEEKIARAVMEAQEKERDRMYMNERFRDMQQMFDERWSYIDHRISTLEQKVNPADDRFANSKDEIVRCNGKTNTEKAS